eukprot:gene9864-biopygen6154
MLRVLYSVLYNMRIPRAVDRKSNSARVLRRRSLIRIVAKRRNFPQHTRRTPAAVFVIINSAYNCFFRRLLRKTRNAASLV